mmetsp:Transcript_22779/g.58095  ORF Transcript_22779/g.58095 Transcript_22779/m.58095 type:complete len:202 (+) Transcript_22779:1843-2448(+)
MPFFPVFMSVPKTFALSLGSSFLPPRPPGPRLRSTGVPFSPGRALVCSPCTDGCVSVLCCLQIRSMNTLSKTLSSGLSEIFCTGSGTAAAVALTSDDTSPSSFRGPSPALLLVSSSSSFFVMRTRAAFLTLMPFGFVPADAAAGAGVVAGGLGDVCIEGGCCGIGVGCGIGCTGAGCCICGCCAGGGADICCGCCCGCCGC